MVMVSIKVDIPIMHAYHNELYGLVALVRTHDEYGIKFIDTCKQLLIPIETAGSLGQV